MEIYAKLYLSLELNVNIIIKHTYVREQLIVIFVKLRILTYMDVWIYKIKPVNGQWKDVKQLKLFNKLQDA